MYLNDEVVGSLNTFVSKDVMEYSIDRGWSKIGSKSKYITWRQGITVAACATTISVGLSTLGPSGVIAAAAVAYLEVMKC